VKWMAGLDGAGFEFPCVHKHLDLQTLDSTTKTLGLYHQTLWEWRDKGTRILDLTRKGYYNYKIVNQCCKLGHGK
ncbi:hypothetical protein BgiMline_011558, partial [Biomphalaria glabrata]